jgi:hypothetical protein
MLPLFLPFSGSIASINETSFTFGSNGNDRLTNTVLLRLNMYVIVSVAERL